MDVKKVKWQKVKFKNKEFTLVKKTFLFSRMLEATLERAYAIRPLYGTTIVKAQVSKFFLIFHIYFYRIGCGLIRRLISLIYVD